MKEKAFYQCEHCVYYTPYYNICENRIWRVSCGHCDFRKKTMKISLRNCQYFQLLTDSEKAKQRCEQIENCEKYLCDTLHRIEKTIKSFKIYLNKDDDVQKLDDCLMEDIKKA